VPRARCSAAMAKTGLPALEGLGCPYRYRSLLLPQEPGIFDHWSIVFLRALDAPSLPVRGDMLMS
jgi:hypothetical protein